MPRLAGVPLLAGGLQPRRLPRPLPVRLAHLALRLGPRRLRGRLALRRLGGGAHHRPAHRPGGGAPVAAAPLVLTADAREWPLRPLRRPLARPRDRDVRGPCDRLRLRPVRAPQDAPGGGPAPHPGAAPGEGRPRPHAPGAAAGKRRAGRVRVREGGRTGEGRPSRGPPRPWTHHDGLLPRRDPGGGALAARARKGGVGGAAKRDLGRYYWLTPSGPGRSARPLTGRPWRSPSAPTAALDAASAQGPT